MSSHVPQEGTRAPLTAVWGRNRLQNAIQNFGGRFGAQSRHYLAKEYLKSLTKTEVVRVQGWTIDHGVMGYPHLLLYVALVAREGALTAP